MNGATAAISVSRLVALLRETVEDNFFQVVVAGELSNLSAPASGHLYFTLKDGDAQLRGVMFRMHNRLLSFQPENGQHVQCHGRVSVYAQRGELQLVVEGMEPAGQGGLQLAFEQLKARLAAEGLFNEEFKRPLPPHPAVIGVVTSATGAAIHDILQVLRRRGAGAEIILAPVRVQGEGAAVEIARAIADLNRHGSAEVLIVGRGGGSLEDLWAFNEEIVARAIRASAIPVISAVGHEVDVTIADFAADLRAATPSAAAELVARGRLELEAHLDHLIARLTGAMKTRLQLVAARLAELTARLRSPQQELARRHDLLLQLEARLERGVNLRLQRTAERLHGLTARLQTLSPLATLERGYAIVFAADNRVARNADQLHHGELLDIRLAHGRVRARVEDVEP